MDVSGCPMKVLEHPMNVPECSMKVPECSLDISVLSEKYVPVEHIN